MNDPNVFSCFLQNHAGVNLARYRVEIQNFIPTFETLLTVSDDEIDEFIKANNAANTSRANNARILLTSNTAVALKTILFELKDRRLCDVMTDAAAFDAITQEQMIQWRGERALSIQEKKELKIGNFQT